MSHGGTRVSGAASPKKSDVSGTDVTRVFPDYRFLDRSRTGEILSRGLILLARDRFIEVDKLQSETKIRLANVLFQVFFPVVLQFF